MNAKNYRRRPTMVQAIRWTPGLHVPGVSEIHPPPSVALAMQLGRGSVGAVQTPSGTVYAKPGDWIIREGATLQVLPDSLFHQLYEEVKGYEDAPIGTILSIAPGVPMPDGWLVCDGTVHVNVTDFSDLHRLMHGGKDTGATFRIPDLRQPNQKNQVIIVKAK